MPLDHYVPQVYLKNFYSLEKRNRLHAINKWSLKRFICDSYSQCRLKNGNTNDYLEEPRAIEIFLKDIEPKLNYAVDCVRRRNINHDSVFIIAGLISYIEGCSPAGSRIAKSVIENSLEAYGALMAAKNTHPQSPYLPETDLSSTSQKPVKIQTNYKYAQSFGITKLMERLYLFGNSTWDIIFNNFSDSAFFTSDYPVAVIESENDPRFKDRIFPLAPDIAIRIRINIDYKYIGVNRLRTFRYRFVEPGRNAILSINRSIIKCAENNIYYRDECSWVLPFVTKNRFFRVEPALQHIPFGQRDFVTTEIAVRRHIPEQNKPSSG